MIIHFEQVKLYAQKKIRTADGKLRTRSKTFMATINPFNKNAVGIPKSRAEVMADLIEERKLWLNDKEPE